MAIPIKSIRNPEMSVRYPDDAPVEHIGNHTVCVGFETASHRYHIWLFPPSDKSKNWHLGPTLYANLIDQPKHNRRGASHLDPAKHEKAIDYALRMSGAGEGTMINGPAVERLIEAHNAKARVLIEERRIAANEAYAATVRERLAVLAQDPALISSAKSLLVAAIGDNWSTADLVKLGEAFRADNR